jgi:Mg-chelatase subunit ChlD
MLGNDIVCIIDKSHSMTEKNKINQVKESMHWLVDNLGVNDRLAIVTFNHNSKRNCKLRLMNKKNRRKIHNYIDKYLVPSGSTSINNGLSKAL